MNIIKIINKSELAKHSKNYIIGDFFTKALSFISIPIFTRLLTTQDYGRLSLYNTFVSIFSILFSLNFGGSISRKYYEKDEDFYEYLYSVFLFLLFFMTVFSLILISFNSYISDYFGISNKVYFLAIISCILGVFFNIFIAYLRASKQSAKFSIMNVLNSIFTLSLAVIFMLALNANKYLGRIYANIIVMLFFAVFSILSFTKLFEKKFEKKHIKYALLFGVPLIPHALSNVILAQFDRIVINEIYGASYTGLYSFAYNVGMIMLVVIGATHKAWSPIFYEKMSQNAYGEIKKIANNYSKGIFYVSFLLILFSKEIVMVMADEKFFPALKIVPIIIISYVFVYLYNLYSSYAFYYKKTVLISLCTMSVGVLNVVLNYVFVPRYGYTAAAYTTLFCYFIFFLFHYANSKFIIKARVIPLKNILKNLSMVLIFIAIYLFLNSYIDSLLMLFMLKIILLVFLGGVLFKSK